MDPRVEERLEDQLITYTAEIEGRVIVVEHVPARVNPDSGERFFSPEVYDRLQKIVWGGEEPTRVIETPVFDFAA